MALINLTRGILVEYGLSIPPLVLQFEFNPQTLSRTRSISIVTGNAPGTRGGYDFALPTETPRVAQGVTIEPEQFSMQILIDATDRMSDPSSPGHGPAVAFGIEPELDTLRSMVEPKTQGPGGVLIDMLRIERQPGVERMAHRVNDLRVREETLDEADQQEVVRSLVGDDRARMIRLRKKTPHLREIIIGETRCAFVGELGH